MNKALRDIIAEHLALLREVGSDESTSLADRLQELSRDIDQLLAARPTSTRGRHARATERRKQFNFDLSCYLSVEFFHRDGMTWTDAYEKVAEDFHVALETVRNRHRKFSKEVN